MRQVLMALAMVLCMHGQVRWDVVQQDGRDYVSLQSLKAFYNFPTMKREGNNLIFKLKVGDQEVTLNGVKFVCTYPVFETSGKIVISRMISRS